MTSLANWGEREQMALVSLLLQTHKYDSKKFMRARDVLYGAEIRQRVTGERTLNFPPCRDLKLVYREMMRHYLRAGEQPGLSESETKRQTYLILQAALVRQIDERIADIERRLA